MSYGESAIEAVDWRNFKVLRGTGNDVPAALLALFRSTTNAEAEQVWWSFENVVFSQDTIYGAAEETVNVLLAALADDRPRLVRSWIIELLFFLLKGGSVEDPSLPGRCRDQACPGLWLLAQEARVTSGRERELVLKVIESIDPRRAGLMRDGLVIPR
jgi:hypothetical protein